MSRQYLVLILTSLLTLSLLVDCKNVLILCPMAPQSHKIVLNSIGSALAARGHQVTFVSSSFQSRSASHFLENTKSKIYQQNITEIVAGNYHKFVQQIRQTLVWERGSVLDHLTFSMDPILQSCHQLYQNDQFMALMNGSTVDLIFVDSFFHDCLMGFVHKIRTKAGSGGGVPFVIVAGLPPPTFITEITGNRLPASFVPNFLLGFLDDMTFFQRLLNLLMNVVMETFLYLTVGQESQKIYRHYLGQDVPDLDEIQKNVAMIMINSNYITNYPRPSLPDVIEIGGVHCRPAKSLPKDLQDFVSGSGQSGIIVFSMGSIVQGQLMPERVRKIFLNVFSRLKQRVIWKWESGLMMDEDEEEPLPKNIKLVTWLPQQDLLGHAQTKLFLTHGGLNSMAEALYHSVPVIGLPVFADQKMNVKKAVRNGYALAIDILGLDEDILESAIERILNDKKFSKRVQKYSKMYRDQQNSPLERAVYWSEFLMRHNGARDLRSATRQLNFVQYYCLDVVVTLFVIIVCFLCLARLFIIISLSFFKKFKENGEHGRVVVVNKIKS